MLDDTIYALASTPGPAARSVLRLSGGDAFEAASACLLGAPLERRRGLRSATLSVASFPAPVRVLCMPGPGSFTGEDCVELHLAGSRALSDAVARRLRQHAREASPGEFTRRAFENGRLDLDHAEAVRSLIEADDEAGARRAVAVLRGGLRDEVDRLRAELLTVLGLVEAGLDFEDTDTGGVRDEEWIGTFEAALESARRFQHAVPRTESERGVLLLGSANAGKSSLCNALSGTDSVLASPIAGTTRDLVPVDIAGLPRLFDAPGDLGSTDEIERASLRRRQDLSELASGAVLVVDPTVDQAADRLETRIPILALVLTRADLEPDPLRVARIVEANDDLPVFLVSTTTGEGVEAFRDYLAQRAGPTGGQRPGRYPSGSGGRGRGSTHGLAVEVVTGLAEALAGHRTGEPLEVFSARLHEVLVRLSEIDGRHSAEDVLDRIFAGFCLGK